MKGRPASKAKPGPAAPAWLRQRAGLLTVSVAAVAGLGWWAWPDGGPADKPAPAPAAAGLAPANAAGSAAAARGAAQAGASLAAHVAAVGGASGAHTASAATTTGTTTALLSPATPLAPCQAQAAEARLAPPILTADALAALQYVEPDEAQLASAWDRTARQLQGSPLPRQQAAGLLMNRQSPSVASPVASLPAPALSGLVSLALASADPTVLQWATGACSAPGAQAYCQGLSARAWVQAEPDNLLAWLPLLAQQPEAREEALQGMARASRADGGWMRWANVVNAARPGDLAPHLRFAFGQRLTSLAAAEPMPAWQGVVTACKDDALADARRRGQCGQIAQLMVDHGRELLTASLGYAIGKRLGWPPEREQAHQALKSAALQIGLSLLRPGVTLDCNAQLHEHWLAQLDQLGEVGLARQRLRSVATAASAAQTPR